MTLVIPYEQSDKSLTQPDQKHEMNLKIFESHVTKILH